MLDLKHVFCPTVVKNETNGCSCIYIQAVIINTITSNRLVNIARTKTTASMGLMVLASTFQTAVPLALEVDLSFRVFL